jgi:transcriptional regulator with XRE-family HTH domain
VESITGSELKREREAAHVSGAELARIMKVNPSTVTRVEQAIEVRRETANRYRAGVGAVLDARAANRQSAAVAASTLHAAAQSLLDAAKVLEAAGA